MFYSPYLSVSADAGGAAEVELGLLHGEGLAHVRVSLAVEAAALAAVHGQLPGLAPRQEAGVAAQAVDAALVRHLVLDLTGGKREREGSVVEASLQRLVMADSASFRSTRWMNEEFFCHYVMSLHRECHI